MPVNIFSTDIYNILRQLYRMTESVAILAVGRSEKSYKICLAMQYSYHNLSIYLRKKHILEKINKNSNFGNQNISFETKSYFIQKHQNCTEILKSSSGLPSHHYKYP